MSPKQQTQSYIYSWKISRQYSTPSDFLDLCEELASLEIDGAKTPVNVKTVSMTNSPAGINLSGQIAEVRGYLSDMERKEFSTAIFVAEYPQHQNAQINLNVPFIHEHVNLTISNGTEEIRDLIEAKVREALPSPKGPTKPEAESVLSKLQKNVSRAATLLKRAKELEAKDSKANERAEAIQVKLKEGTESAEQIKQLLGTATSDTNKSSEILAEINKKKAAIETIASQIQNIQNAAESSKNKVGAIEEKILNFHAEIDKRIGEHNEYIESTSNRVDNFEKRTKEVVERNEKYQGEIEKQLHMATGAALFGAFDLRKKRIFRAKVVWGILSVLSVLLEVLVFYWISEHTVTEGKSLIAQPGFLLRLSVIIPVLVLIVFCFRQYAKEREIEEVYAFKSALSFSLSPYLELVRGMEKGKEDSKYAEFATSTIKQIFQNPLLDPAEASKMLRKEGLITKEAIEYLSKLLDTLKSATK